MTQFDQIFNELKSSNDYLSNGRGAQYLTNVLQNSKKITPSDKAECKKFALGEMQRLIREIPLAESYRTRDDMFFYENYLLGIYTLSVGGFENASEADRSVIERLLDTVDNARKLERAVELMFEEEKIDEQSARSVVEIAKHTKDDYERAMMYRSLLNNKEQFNKFSVAAKSVIGEYIADDMQTVLSHSPFSDDDLLNLEYSVDICAGFMNQRIFALLQEVLKTDLNRVRYYAVVTLLDCGKEVDGEAIRQLAEDNGYASWLFEALKKRGKTRLFPQELATPEYLAESDMVQWLMYPTELGKKPDKIELLGTATKKKETYYIYKYMSDSDCLSDDIKNKWLIGWSSEDGGTFSNFDLLSDYEQKTAEKTVKYIAKKLL